MKPQWIFLILVSLAVAASASIYNQETDSSSKTASQEVDNGANKDQENLTDSELTKEIANLQQQLDSYKKINQKLVSQLMRVVHREPDSPLVVFNELIAAEDPQPNWLLLEAKAKLVETMATSLQTPQSNGANYLDVATKLRDSTKEKDFAAFQQNVKLLQTSCSACHGWSPPK